MTLEPTFRWDFPGNDEYEIVVTIRDPQGRSVNSDLSDVAAQIHGIAMHALQQLQGMSREMAFNPLKFRAIIPLTPLESGKRSQLYVDHQEITSRVALLAESLQRDFCRVIVPSRFTYPGLPAPSEQPSPRRARRRHSAGDSAWELP